MDILLRPHVLVVVRVRVRSRAVPVLCGGLRLRRIRVDVLARNAARIDDEACRLILIQDTVNVGARPLVERRNVGRIDICRAVVLLFEHDFLEILLRDGNRARRDGDVAADEVVARLVGPKERPRLLRPVIGRVQLPVFPLILPVEDVRPPIPRERDGFILRDIAVSRNAACRRGRVLKLLAVLVHDLQEAGIVKKPVCWIRPACRHVLAAVFAAVVARRRRVLLRIRAARAFLVVGIAIVHRLDAARHRGENRKRAPLVDAPGRTRDLAGRRVDMDAAGIPDVVAPAKLGRIGRIVQRNTMYVFPLNGRRPR